jgi:hypothetical protein
MTGTSTFVWCAGTAVVYCPAPTGVAVTDTANIVAAINALPVGTNYGGTVRLQEGQYLIASALPNLPGVSLVGAGRYATDLNVQAGANLYAPTAAMRDMVFEKLCLTTNGLHLFDLSAGGLTLTAFRDCLLRTYADAASLFYLRGNNDFLEVSFENCILSRTNTATVPAFDLINTNGGLNVNTWHNCRVYSGLNAGGGPFFRLESPNDSCYDNCFRNITGEENPGGLIHVYSPDGLILDNVTDWDDGATAFTNHLCLVAVTTGLAPKNIFVQDVTARAATNMGAWKSFFSEYGPYWQQYVTTLSGAGWALGNGVANCRYVKIGMTVHWAVRIVWGDTSTFGAGGLTLTLPITAAPVAENVASSGAALDQGVGVYFLIAWHDTTTTVGLYTTAATATAMTGTVPFIPVAGDMITVSGTYEAAA